MLRWHNYMLDPSTFCWMYRTHSSFLACHSGNCYLLKETLQLLVAFMITQMNSRSWQLCSLSFTNRWQTSILSVIYVLSWSRQCNNVSGTCKEHLHHAVSMMSSVEVQFEFWMGTHAYIALASGRYIKCRTREEQKTLSGRTSRQVRCRSYRYRFLAL